MAQQTRRIRTIRVGKREIGRSEWRHAYGALWRQAQVPSMASQTKVYSMGFARHKAPKVRRHKGFVKAVAIKQSQTAPPKKLMANGQWLKAVKVNGGSTREPLLLLINQIVLF